MEPEQIGAETTAPPTDPWGVAAFGTLSAPDFASIAQDLMLKDVYIARLQARIVAQQQTIASLTSEAKPAARKAVA